MTASPHDSDPQSFQASQDTESLYVSQEYPGLTQYLKSAPEGFAQAEPRPGFQSIRSDWDAKVFGKDVTHAQEFLERCPDGVFVQTYFEDGSPIGGQAMAMEPAPVETEPVRKGIKVRVARALGFTGAKQ